MAVLTSVISSCALPQSVMQAAISENPDSIIETHGAQETSQLSGTQQEVLSAASGEISLFDFNEIIVSPTNVLDLEVRNCNVYQDIYGDLLVFGEIINNSKITKTNMEITLSFFDQKKSNFESQTIPAYAEYLQTGHIMPFYYIYENKEKYIDISEIKIGINYRNHNKKFEGYPVVADEDFSYDKNLITIKGNILNMGNNEIENLKLLCTFYNIKNQVVFIRECFLKKDKMAVLEKQNFEVKILLDDYIEEFTHYGIEVFYRDSLKV